MKSGRRYVRKDFVAAALAVCFMCCGCGNGQEEALADSVIGGDAEAGGLEDAVGERPAAVRRMHQYLVLRLRERKTKMRRR